MVVDGGRWWLMVNDAEVWVLRVAHRSIPITLIDKKSEKGGKEGIKVPLSPVLQAVVVGQIVSRIDCDCLVAYPV